MGACGAAGAGGQRAQADNAANSGQVRHLTQTCPLPSRTDRLRPPSPTITSRASPSQTAPPRAWRRRSGHCGRNTCGPQEQTLAPRRRRGSFSFSVPWVAVAGHAPVPPAHRRGCPTSRGPRVGGTAGARSGSGKGDVGRCVPYGYGPTREVGADPNQLPLLVARNALARRFLPAGAACLALGAAERRGPPRAVVR